MIGLSLCVASALAVGALAAVWIMTTSPTTRLLAWAVGLPLLVILATSGLGTWRWFTLSYALAPTALVIRHGLGQHRIRYEEIARVVRSVPGEPLAVPCLWPGAPAGDTRLDSGKLARWCGTSHRRTHWVLVECDGTAILLTPSDPGAFCDALVAHARAAGGESTGAAPLARGWLEVIAGVDGWFRFLAVLAVGVAVIGMTAAVLTVGEMGRPGIVAVSSLLVNTAVGVALLPHSREGARVLMGATMGLQFLGPLA